MEALRLPESLAERALARRRRRRPRGAAGHLAGDQRARTAGRLCGHPACRPCSPRRWRCWPFICPAPSCAPCCAASPSPGSRPRSAPLAFLISVGGGSATLQRRSARRARAGDSLAGMRGGLLPGLLPHAGSRRRAPARNFHTYSTFGILLAVAGSRILLSGAAAAVAWSVLAVAAIWVGGIFLRLTLKVHGCIYPAPRAGRVQRAGTGGGPAAGVAHVARRRTLGDLERRTHRDAVLCSSERATPPR